MGLFARTRNYRSSVCGAFHLDCCDSVVLFLWINLSTFIESNSWINTRLYCSFDNGDSISRKHVNLHKLTTVGFDEVNYLLKLFCYILFLPYFLPFKNFPVFCYFLVWFFFRNFQHNLFKIITSLVPILISCTSINLLNAW